MIPGRLIRRTFVEFIWDVPVPGRFELRFIRQRFVSEYADLPTPWSLLFGGEELQFLSVRSNQKSIDCASGSIIRHIPQLAIHPYLS